MVISIFGLGYVGCVGLGAIAELGFDVIGVDISEHKVNLINSGKATIVEKGIDNLIEKNFTSGKISATIDNEAAILRSDVVIICVGTPNDSNGHLDMSNIYKVSESIGKTLAKKKDFLTIAIRSTVMPGTNEEVTKIIESSSGKKPGEAFGVVSNPEFLREGSAVDDFFNPPYTLLASNISKSLEVMSHIYKGINAEIITTDVGVAEIIKFVNNTYHGLKVVFANEIGRICKVLNLDSHKVMDIFVKDKVLNISPYYFKPGFAYGGSCLPKDLKALNTIAHDMYLDLDVLSSISRSNDSHVQHALNLIVKKEKQNIGMFGISFKSGTDDLRFSPGLEITESLLGKGFNVKIYDSNVILSRLTGKNKEFLYSKLPHINEILIDDLDLFLQDLEVLVVVNKDIALEKLLEKNLQKIEIIDFVKSDEIEKFASNYEGICW